jgi:hypothetical protein
MILVWLAELLGLKGVAKSLFKWGLRLLVLTALALVLFILKPWHLLNPTFWAHVVSLLIMSPFWAVFIWVEEKTRRVKWVLRLGVLISTLVLLGLSNNWYEMLAAVGWIWPLWRIFQWAGDKHTLVKWALRRGVVAGLIGTEIFASGSPTYAEVASLAMLAVLASDIYQWWRNRESGEAEQGQRTIDGKLVPVVLASAALDVPRNSPTPDFVQRALPDYGKTLLKLDPNEFFYEPEIWEPELEPEPVLESPAKDPAKRRFDLTRQLRAGWNDLREDFSPGKYSVWAWAISIVFLSVGMGLFFYRVISETHRDRELTSKFVDAKLAAEQAETNNPTVASQTAEGGWTDKTSGLTWQRKPSDATMTWTEANDYCRHLQLGRSSVLWRLSSRDELQDFLSHNSSVIDINISDSKTHFFWSNQADSIIALPVFDRWGNPVASERPPLHIDDSSRYYALCVTSLFK